MTHLICTQFGTPSNEDLLSLQNLCIKTLQSDEYTKNFLLFLCVHIGLLFILVFLFKAFMSNPEHIKSFYKSSYLYFIQIFTIVSFMPFIVFYLTQEFTSFYKLIVTVGVLTLVYLMYEYWPVFKQNMPVQNFIYPSILSSLFALSYFFLLSTNMDDPKFSKSILMMTLCLYLIIINIFIRLLKEVKSS